MKLLYWVSTVFTFANIQQTSAQSYFQQIWGDSSRTEKGIAVQQLADGFVYFLGYNSDGEKGSGDITVTKLDPQGNILWHHYYGTSSSDSPTSFAYQNGVFVITGETHYSNSTDVDALIQRVDTAGNDLGLYHYGSPLRTEQLNSITYDNGAWIATGFVSDDLGSNNLWLLRFTGISWTNPDWEKDFGVAGMTEVGAQALPVAGGYVVVGDQMHHTGFMQTYTLRLDNRGDIVWEFTVPFAYNSGSKSAIINTDNQLVIIGESATATSAFFDVYFTRMRLDTPIVLHQNLIPGSDKGDAGFQIFQRNNNDYVITGYSFNVPNDNMDVFLASIDSMGIENEHLLLGSPQYDIATGLYPHINGNGFWVAGAAGTQYFLAYQDVAQTPTGLQTLGAAADDWSPYPNPCNGMLSLPNLPHAAQLKWINTQGQLVAETPYTSEVQLNFLPMGIYLLQVYDKEGNLLKTRKLLRIE